MIGKTIGNSHLVALVRDSLPRGGERCAPPSTVREDRQRYEMSGPMWVVIVACTWTFGPLVMLSLFAWALS